MKRQIAVFSKVTISAWNENFLQKYNLNEIHLLNYYLLDVGN